MPNHTQINNKNFTMTFLKSCASEMMMSLAWFYMFERVSNYCNTDEIVSAADETLEFIISEAYIINQAFQKIADDQLSQKKKVLLLLLTMINASPIVIVYFFSSEKLQIVVANSMQNTTNTSDCITSPDNMTNLLKLFIFVANNLINMLWAKPWMDLFQANKCASLSSNDESTEALLEFSIDTEPRTPERSSSPLPPPPYTPSNNCLLSTPPRLLEERMKKYQRDATTPSPNSRQSPSIGFRFSPDQPKNLDTRNMGSVRSWLEASPSPTSTPSPASQPN